MSALHFDLRQEHKAVRPSIEDFLASPIGYPHLIALKPSIGRSRSRSRRSRTAIRLQSAKRLNR